MLRPIKVNPTWLLNLWGFTHADEARWSALNLERDESLLAWIRHEIQPSYEHLPVRPQQRLKETLRCAITLWDDSELLDAFDSAQLPFNRPGGPIRDLYRRVWHELFPHEAVDRFDRPAYVQVSGPPQAMFE